MKVTWTLFARTQLKQISDYIKQTNPQNAQRWTQMILLKTRILADQPEIGQISPLYIRPEIRELKLKNYRVIYRIDNATGIVYVLTIANDREELNSDAIPL